MPPQITQIFFDCDNTLVLSEDLAFEACADLSNEILAKRNIPDRYTSQDLIQDFVGQNFRGMMVSLQAKYNFVMPTDELEYYVKEEENRVTAKLEEKAQPCPGVNRELEKLAQTKQYGFAVVSSSALRRVQASIKRVGQDKYFDHRFVFSAASSLPKPTTKPDPAIYLHAMQVVHRKPENCVAIEDSKSGSLAAIRAGIPLIGYVGCYEGETKKMEMAKLLHDLGAKVIMRDWSEIQSCLEQIEDAE